MDILDVVRAWLEAHGFLPAVDSCGPNAGDAGLFPLGRELLQRRQDVLGNTRERVRYSFSLRQTAVPGEAAAKVFLQLQTAAAGNPPQLGENQLFRAEKGKLLKNASTGLAIYEVRLIAEREETL